jgi:hypothetical protein
MFVRQEVRVSGCREVYQRVIDDYSHDPAPALREIVTRALEAASGD